MKAAPGQQMIDKNKLKANIVAVAVLLTPGGAGVVDTLLQRNVGSLVLGYIKADFCT